MAESNPIMQLLNAAEDQRREAAHQTLEETSALVFEAQALVKLMREARDVAKKLIAAAAGAHDLQDAIMLTQLVNKAVHDAEHSLAEWERRLAGLQERARRVEHSSS